MMGKYIKVLHVGADNIGFGGRSTVAYNLAINMNDDIIHNDFLAFKSVDPSFKEIINKKKGKVVRVKNRSNNVFLQKINTIIQVVTLMKKNHYDIVHIHADNAPEVLKVIIMCEISSIKNIVIHAHSAGQINHNNLLTRFYLKVCQKILDVTKAKKIAVTKKAAKYMFGQYLKNVIIVHNGIDIKRYLFDDSLRIQERDKLGISDNFVIGCVARLSKIKNHLFLLDVFKEVLNKESDAKLVLVGDGPLKNEIETYAKKNKIWENIVFLGNRKDVPRLLQMFDVFVLPSFHEGLGVVNIEAQTAGLPCVVSDGVPVEAKILSDFVFLSLSDSKRTWANTILSFNSFERKNTESEIRHAGYDVSVSAKKVQTIYLSLVKI